jgi:hypothetical protein
MWKSFLKHHFCKNLTTFSGLQSEDENCMHATHWDATCPKLDKQCGVWWVPHLVVKQLKIAIIVGATERNNSTKPSPLRLLESSASKEDDLDTWFMAVILHDQWAVMAASHSYAWQRWCSDTLWATLIRLWPHILLWMTLMTSLILHVWVVMVVITYVHDAGDGLIPCEQCS